MRIEWTREAAAALQAKFDPPVRVWKLVSDNEGCGCAVNGVPFLWAVDAPAEGDLRADSEPVEVWYEPRHAVYFDDALRVSYDGANRSFKLSSDGQIYTNALGTVDLRTSASTHSR
ncbi:iron-sulfur cluster biosynthesis family protein [Cohnella rhizosphaerae]|uniref:Iron-sulfur cluster biosynthesis family protein n=1 Tax=Cohnella rhizosphaerae TaxID=1457232 RepID=A0A9X4KZ06_9BACL|nr:iron-sulfur cluster biosynthesis family protein [Cohnella rhizosphaerae]MDG0813016.1 iron-sulfur cluster biosynthesis family protein [Cohnella rhizosphaerae]